jgi:hypothetical protein
VGDAIGSCLGMLGGAAESQRLALAVLGSAWVHGGAGAGEDRGPLECLREVWDAAVTSRALSDVDVHERAAERTVDFFNFFEADQGSSVACRGRFLSQRSA